MPGCPFLQTTCGVKQHPDSLFFAGNELLLTSKIKPVLAGWMQSISDLVFGI